MSRNIDGVLDVYANVYIYHNNTILRSTLRATKRTGLHLMVMKSLVYRCITTISYHHGFPRRLCACANSVYQVLFWAWEGTCTRRLVTTMSCYYAVLWQKTSWDGCYKQLSSSYNAARSGRRNTTSAGTGKVNAYT